jgi:hypothetical protein
VSSCVTKATAVVRRLPRADVALPMPFLGDHGNKQQKKKKKAEKKRMKIQSSKLFTFQKDRGQREATPSP